MKSAGPLLLGGRSLPAWVTRVADLAPAALLAGLVATSTFGRGGDLVIDARLSGLAVAVIALRLRIPFVLIVVLAAVATALTRTIA